MERDHMPTNEAPPSYSPPRAGHPIQLPSISALPQMDSSAVRDDRKLPPISAPSLERPSRPTDVVEPPTPWANINPLSVYYGPSAQTLSPATRSSATMDSPRPMDLDGDARSRRGVSVLSMDDPDVRLAAEALGDLRADFVSSPPHQHSALPHSGPSLFHGNSSRQQPEPLLSLLTTSHPLIGTAIGGSLNAYSASKTFSPRFKSSAEYIEKKITPVVNTVGSVSRFTGVEGSVRWFLGGRRPSHQKPSDNEDETSHKRRKVADEMEVDTNHSRDPYPVYRQDLFHRERRNSQVSMVESLPAYDDHKSPSYVESNEQALILSQPNSDSPTNPSSAWHQRLVLSTSGLSIAMSEESLRSLKYCLGWLRWANEHIGKVIDTLKIVLEELEGPNALSNSSHALTNGEAVGGTASNGQLILRSDADRVEMHAKIAELKSDVLKTLKNVVDVVSKYAGGALPENARDLVKRHLTSLPRRFTLASRSRGQNAPASGDGEVAEGARKVMVLAKEGLDMMSQVSGVLDGTIVSAEEWCERLGRKKRDEVDVEVEVGDVSMLKEPVRRYEDGHGDAAMQDGNGEMR